MQNNEIGGSRIPFVTRFMLITFFFVSILFSAGSYVHVAKVYSQGELEQGQIVCAPEELSANVCSPEEQLTASCGPNMVDDVFNQRCSSLILEKYRYLLSDMEHLTPVFQTSKGQYCNPLGENCNVRNYPNFWGCTILITDESTVCSKRVWGTQKPDGVVNRPPHWYEPPNYEKMFPEPRKHWAPCSLSELYQFYNTGKEAGDWFGFGIELASAGGKNAAVTLVNVVAEVGQQELDVPSPVGVISKYTGGVVGGALGGIYCGVGKLDQAIQKLKNVLNDQREKNLVKLKSATEKWCSTYDNQKGENCLFLISKFYDCLERRPLGAPSYHPVADIYFVEGALAQGKDPCLWKLPSVYP